MSLTMSLGAQAVASGFLGLPDVVWSGIIASVLTLSGVLISNRSNTKRLRMQLEHDAVQKEKDRHGVIKRDAYMRFAQEIVNTGGLMGGIAGINFAKVGNPVDLTLLQVATTHASLISSGKTTALINELSSLYTAAVLRLIGEAMPINKLLVDADIASGFYERSQLEVQRITAALKAEDESSSPDRVRKAALLQAWKSELEVSSKHSDEHNEALLTIARKKIEFAQFVYDEIEKLSETQEKTLVAMRAELGADSDVASYIDQLKKSKEIIRKAAQEISDKTAEMLNDVEKM